MINIGPVSEPVENVAFIKEFQRRESKDSINFLKNLPAEKKAELTGKNEFLSTTAPLKSTTKSVGGTAKDAQAHMSDNELLNHLSMNLWRRVNAGYMIERRKCLSLARASYQWDSKQIEKGTREYMHKRDMFSEYVEAAARFKLLIKDTKKSVVPKYVPRALRPQTPGRKWYAPPMKLPPGYNSGETPTATTPGSTPLPPIANPATTQPK